MDIYGEERGTEGKSCDGFTYNFLKVDGGVLGSGRDGLSILHIPPLSLFCST